MMFLVVPFNKIPLFFKEPITFMKSFISLFVRVIPEPKNFLLNASIPVFTNCFAAFFAASLANVHTLFFAIFSPILKAANIRGKGTNHPAFTVLDKLSY